MECSEYSYYISEYVDNRLNLVMNQKIEEHLKKCPQCGKLYKDLVEMRELFKVKSYEKPQSEYFDHLKRNIRRRIISQDVISWHEAISRYFTQPSWVLTAAISVFLLVSVSLNVMFFVKQSANNSLSSSQLSLASNIQQDDQDTQAEPDPQIFYNTAQNTPYSNNWGSMVHPASMQTGNNQRNSFLLRPVSVKNIYPSKQVKIYQ